MLYYYYYKCQIEYYLILYLSMYSNYVSVILSVPINSLPALLIEPTRIYSSPVPCHAHSPSHTHSFPATPTPPQPCCLVFKVLSEHHKLAPIHGHRFPYTQFTQTVQWLFKKGKTKYHMGLNFQKLTLHSLWLAIEMKMDCWGHLVGWDCLHLKVQQMAIPTSSPHSHHPTLTSSPYYITSSPHSHHHHTYITSSPHSHHHHTYITSSPHSHHHHTYITSSPHSHHHNTYITSS